MRRRRYIYFITFSNDFSVYYDISPDIVIAVNLATLETYYHDISCTSNLLETPQQDFLGHSPNHGLNKTNFATLVNERYKGKFVI